MQQNEFNPYSPPDAPIAGGAQTQTGEETHWRDGKDLVVRRGASLPARCVKCNAPATSGLKPRTFYWHAPGWFALVVCGILLYAIVAIIVRKSAVHGVALCEAHTKRRNAFIYGGIAAFVLGLVMVFSGDTWIGLGLALTLVGLFGGALGARILVPTRIDEHYSRFRGASKAFLASLPPLPAHRRR